MIEIKFRVFDKASKLNAMHIVGEDSHDSFWIDSDNVFHYRNLQNEEGSGECGDYILMQYTGLKDKNGKEIYEGDIVEAWSEGKKAIGKVKQRIDGLWLMYPAWQSGKSWGLMPNKERKTTVKIIGNIYENKELIGEKEQ